MPFKLMAVNTDSGSEWINSPMMQFIFTRSRPYKKNDHCYVEQSNFTHVRSLDGQETIVVFVLLHVRLEQQYISFHRTH